jgi:hypothetical protein
MGRQANPASSSVVGAPVTYRRAKRQPRLSSFLIAAVILVASVLGFGHGFVQGPSAAAADAAAAEWTWGSTAFIGQWQSAAAIFAGALVIATVCAFFIGASPARWRQAGLVALVVIAAASTAIGFIVGYGSIGGGSGTIASTLGIAAGALVGYGAGRRLSRVASGGIRGRERR